MKKLFFILFFLAFTFSCFSQQKKLTLEDTLRGTLSPERTCFDVHFYDLSLSVDLKKHLISGHNIIHFTATEDFSIIQLDLFKELNIRKITDEKDSILTYTRRGNAFFVRFRETQSKGSRAFIKIQYDGEPHTAINPPWDGGFVWALDSLDRPWVSVACEGIGASLWWPCKDHPADEPDSMRMRFEVPENLFCASNGNLVSSKQNKRQTKIYEWKVSYPINTYNITLNIGAYEHISDQYLRDDGSALALDYYVLSYNKDKAKKHFQQVKPMLACYEKIWGRYPFDKDGYAIIESPYWGMEHQSAIAYGNRYKNNMVGLDYILVHESGHEWWGNYVSASDHADLWIHEAFTTYGETLLLECLSGKEAADKYITGQKRLIKNREAIIGPYGVNYHYWLDSDMYYKGAWMLHTLRHSLDNDSLWFALLHSIQTRFGNKQVSSPELINHINEFTKYNYTGFFAQYLLHTNLPTLEYKIIRKDKKNLKLRYRWTANDKTFSLPLILKINGRPVKINPTHEYQTLTVPDPDGKTPIDFNTVEFYIETRQVKGK